MSVTTNDEGQGGQVAGSSLAAPLTVPTNNGQSEAFPAMPGITASTVATSRPRRTSQRRDR